MQFSLGSFLPLQLISHSFPELNYLFLSFALCGVSNKTFFAGFLTALSSHGHMQILRLMQDYKDNSVLLLPPRVPGEGLPSELLDYYKEYCSKMKDEGIFKDT